MFPFLRLSYLLVLKRLSYQHKNWFSLPHPPYRSTVSLSISLTGPNTVCVLPLSYMPLPLLDWATLPPRKPQRRFDSTALFDSATLTGAILPPHAELPLVIDRDSEKWSKEYQIDLGGPGRSNLSHHLRTAQSVEVEGASTPVCMLGGPTYCT